MKKYILVLGIITIVSFVLSGCTEVELQDWIWELNNNDWTEIKITQEMINSVGSNNPSVLFESVSDTRGCVIFGYEADGVTIVGSWTSTREILGYYQSLTTINVDDVYFGKASPPQTLIIERK